MRKLLLTLSALGMLFTLPTMKGDTIITDPTGQFSVGIGPDGELFTYDGYTGFMRLADGYDPLAPGTPRDSWGIYGNGSAAYADQAYYGDFGVSSTFTTTANTASYTTTTSNDFTVTQNYSFVAPNVLEIATSITNDAATATDVLFQRDVDWDVSPTEYDENTFANPIPGGTAITGSSYYGFENPDPSVPYGYSCTAGCNNTADLGGGISLDLGLLGPGATTSFNYFYAISQFGESAVGLDTQVTGLGSIYNVTTQSSENGAFPDLGTNSALIGFGPSSPSSVPEPSSIALLTTAAAGLGMLVRRRRKTADK
jgi:PEP-CTERM motif